MNPLGQKMRALNKEGGSGQKFRSRTQTAAMAFGDIRFRIEILHHFIYRHICTILYQFSYTSGMRGPYIRSCRISTINSTLQPFASLVYTQPQLATVPLCRSELRKPKTESMYTIP